MSYLKAFEKFAKLASLLGIDAMLCLRVISNHQEGENTFAVIFPVKEVTHSSHCPSVSLLQSWMFELSSSALSAEIARRRLKAPVR